MANIRRILPLAYALALVLLAGALSPQPPAWAASVPSHGAFSPVGENSAFQLLADPATLAFQVVDKRSGYVWSSNLAEVTPEDKLNRTWTVFARSGISIDYLDQKAISKRASLTSAETLIDFRPVAQGFDATVTFTEPAITLAVAVRLEETGVSVAVPFAAIKAENPDFKLGVLYVYPFLGATKADTVSGYMFIPDGVGSLIQFSAATKAKNMFYGRYYGSDLGMLATLPYDPTINRPYRLSLPVFGLAHTAPPTQAEATTAQDASSNAFIAIVTQGAAYGELQAHPAGVITQFNFLYTAFVYNESYFQATNRSGAGVTALQPSPNAFDVEIHYRFVTGDEGNIVGMARSYQQYLVARGELQPMIAPDEDIGIRLEFLGGENEKVLVWRRSIPMTTLAQMAAILADLEVKHPEVIYYAWQPLGASAMPPASLQLDRQLGSVAQLRTLAADLVAAGGHFSLYLDPQAALVDEPGYSPRYDLAMSITNANLLGYSRSKINYYFNYPALRERYDALSRDLTALPGVGLALDGIGSMLYSDFKAANLLNREEAIQAYQQMLAAHPLRTAFYLPNAYLFGAMSAYYDMPLNNSGYLYTTEATPFLPIVLAGYVPAYGPALNFSSNLQDDLLRLADYGVYPSYFLSHEATAKILNTPSSWIYTSSYAQWGAEIEATYRWLNALLGPVRGQPVLARQTLAPGVVATTYGAAKAQTNANANAGPIGAWRIIVNYNDTPFVQGEVVVGAKDAVIVPTEVTP